MPSTFFTVLFAIFYLSIYLYIYIYVYIYNILFTYLCDTRLLLKNAIVHCAMYYCCYLFSKLIIIIWRGGLPSIDSNQGLSPCPHPPPHHPLQSVSIPWSCSLCLQTCLHHPHPQKAYLQSSQPLLSHLQPAVALQNSGKHCCCPTPHPPPVKQPLWTPPVWFPPTSQHSNCPCQSHQWSPHLCRLRFPQHPAITRPQRSLWHCQLFHHP